MSDFPPIGDNSGDDTFDVSDEELTDANTESQLLAFFERRARLEEEKKGISDDIKDVWAELKASGFDSKVAMQAYRLWKMPADDRREMETILDLYKASLGLD